MTQPVYVRTPPPVVVAFPLTELRVGHTRQVITGGEFSLSLRGHLRCLGAFRPGGRSWVSLEPGRAPTWLLSVAAAAEQLLLADPRLVPK